MATIDVACDPADGGWSCTVRVSEGGASTSHRVTVAATDLARLDPGAADPTELVRGRSSSCSSASRRSRSSARST